MNDPVQPPGNPYGDPDWDDSVIGALARVAIQKLTGDPAGMANAYEAVGAAVHGLDVLSALVTLEVAAHSIRDHLQGPDEFSPDEISRGVALAAKAVMHRIRTDRLRVMPPPANLQ